MNAANQRVVALVDMDCFYCQVETRLNPELKGKPMAVVQYNQWKGGGIIAVNYEARDKGVTRHMRGSEAKEKCPEIILVSVPSVRGKADLTNYRDAGDEVAKVFSEFSDCVQRASIDEAFLDLTKAVQDAIKNQNEEVWLCDLPNTFVVGYSEMKSNDDSDRRKGLTQWLNKVGNERTITSGDYQLAVGAKIVEKMRSEIQKRTGFHCSAGIAHNKILAKLCAGLHKPKRQTVLPLDSLPELYETLPIQKVRNLGGKLGKHVMDTLSINYMSELYNFSLGQLQQKFDEKTSAWLYNIARGIDMDPVTSRLSPESIGCCKNFRGINSLKTKTIVEHWLKELASEISDRLHKELEKNNRRAKQLVVSFSQSNSMTRCGPLNSYEPSRIASDAMDMLKKFNSASASEDVWNPPLEYLGLSASKFVEETSSIEKYFKNVKTSRYSVGSLDLPSCSKVLVLNNQIKKNEKQPEMNGSNKKIEKSNHSIRPKTINNSKQSFFLGFLNSKKNNYSSEETTDNSEEEKNKEETGDSEQEEAETWISLSELFPDVNEAEPEVIENLPEPLRKKFKKLVHPVSECQETNENSTEEESQNIRIEPDVETCQECGKSLPKSELPVHMDYHAALKLYTEINKPSNSIARITNRPEEKESLTKKKKKGPLTPTKKMKSLKSFFAPITKK